MKKSLFDLAIEYTGYDKHNLTEFQENEIDALVKFGKRVLENAAQQSEQADGVCVHEWEHNSWYGTRCKKCHSLKTLTA